MTDLKTLRLQCLAIQDELKAYTIVTNLCNAQDIYEKNKENIGDLAIDDYSDKINHLQAKLQSLEIHAQEIIQETGISKIEGVVDVKISTFKPRVHPTKMFNLAWELFGEKHIDLPIEQIEKLWQDKAKDCYTAEKTTVKIKWL